MTFFLQNCFPGLRNLGIFEVDTISRNLDDFKYREEGHKMKTSYNIIK